MMDGFDVFFHRDPFEVLTATDTMVFFEEGWALGVAGRNIKWLWRCYGPLAFPVFVNQTLCSGTLYGGTAVFIQFLRTLLELWPPREKCHWDQAVLNFLMYTNEFERRGIKVTTVGCTGPVLTLVRCPYVMTPVGVLLEPQNADGKIPHVVHQWKNYDPFRTVFPKMCRITELLNQYENVTFGA
jgi:hypothetical protein